MSFCKIKLSEESDLVTIRGIKGGKDGLGKVYNILKDNGFEPWVVCQQEVFRTGADLTFLIPTGRLCDLLTVVKQIKKTTPRLTTLIRTGVVKTELCNEENFDLLTTLLSNKDFPKPELICASQDKIELIFESHNIPTAVSVISQMDC